MAETQKSSIRQMIEDHGLSMQRAVRLLLLRLIRVEALDLDLLGGGEGTDRDPGGEVAFADSVIDAAEEHLDLDEVESTFQDWEQRAGAESLESYASVPEVGFNDLADRLNDFSEMPDEKRKFSSSGLIGTRVALTRSFISDQLEFVGVAKQYLKMRDFEWVAERTIGPSKGQGRIGGKAAGMLLGHRILREAEEASGDKQLRVQLPESWFLRSDVIQRFLSFNGFVEFQNQKYKKAEDVRDDYPVVRRLFRRGSFPSDIIAPLEAVLRETAGQPLIVRSSSLLEDRFGAAFSGKYSSIFLGNQGPLKDRLRSMLEAIAEVYASTLAPMPILYRRRHNLIDYNEDMAVLIQRVVGRKHGRYFFPGVAGVAFSRNEYRWAPRIRQEDGMARVVMGLGTRAVDRTGNDWPRIVALGAPTLRSEIAPARIRRYSQRFIDVVDLKDNQLKTVTLADLLAEGPDPPGLHWAASLYHGGTLIEPASGLMGEPAEDLCLTFDRLIRRTPFATRLREQLGRLEDAYGTPVDVEYALVDNKPYLLQCRPQALAGPEAMIRLPSFIPTKEKLFHGNEVMRSGEIKNIEMIVYVDPEAYQSISDPVKRIHIGRAVGRINDALEKKNFLLLGPGRWGTMDAQLGVKVSYAEINHCRVLIEIARPRGGFMPDLSYGTHFFQELVEDGIYYLSLHPDENGGMLDEKSLRAAPNHLSDWVERDRKYEKYIRVVHTKDLQKGSLQLVMDSEAGESVCWFV